VRFLLAAAIVLLLASSASAAPDKSRVPVIVSTDLATGLVNGSRAGPSDIDDGLAAVMALAARGLSVRGVVVTYGNNDAGPETIVARRILHGLLGSKVPVVEGAAVKLSSPQVQWFNHTQIPGACLNAGVRFMARQLQRGPAEVLALGPLTDVACLVQNDPKAARRITKVIAIMGRQPNESFSINGHLGLTDFNFRLDPRAAGILLNQTKIPVTFMTFPTTSDTFVPTSKLAPWKHGHALQRFLYNAVQPWLGFWNDHFGQDGFHPWDQNAVYNAMSPTVCKCLKVGFKIVQCGPVGGPSPCAGHGPSQPASLNSETAQLWLDPTYSTRRVTAGFGYLSEAAETKFEQLAVSLVSGA
jgi:pyrimidine-specific ribonucleoside hydrolase